MNAHLKYLRYVFRHKWWVFVAGLRVGGISLWRLLIHDWSKFTPAEWTPYARYFYGDNSGEGMEAIGRFGLAELAPWGFYARDRFNVAWLHHYHVSPHHWEHWLFRNDRGATFPLPMPEHFAREMVADWMGAGRAITGRWEIAEWYAKNRERIELHPQTRVLVDSLVAPREEKP